MPNPLALAVCSALFAQGWPGPVQAFVREIAHAEAVCRFEASCEVPAHG